ncbi:MAG TPA: TSUP family transporter, partial [Burkholderiales bacterium]|nr:TSUP family transporter [Burkholderiales bacterium]
PLVGVFSGILTGATGIFVIPAVPYFSSLALKKDDLIQVFGLSFTVSTVALAIGLIASGQFKSTAALSSLLALLPALGGMFMGRRIRDRFNPDVFRRWFFIALCVLGLYMVVRAVA